MEINISEESAKRILDGFIEKTKYKRFCLTKSTERCALRVLYASTPLAIAVFKCFDGGLSYFLITKSLKTPWKDILQEIVRTIENNGRIEIDGVPVASKENLEEILVKIDLESI